MTYIGVPLVIGGLIVKSEDDHFRSLRNDYLPGSAATQTIICSMPLPR